jgi:hypothetical protein
MGLDPALSSLVRARLGHAGVAIAIGDATFPAQLLP